MLMQSLGGWSYPAAFLRLHTACRGGYGKVRVNGKKQQKSPCEAVL